MTENPEGQAPMVQPMIDELTGKQKPKEEVKGPPPGPLHPPQPGEVFQEPDCSGSPDDTCPQAEV